MQTFKANLFFRVISFIIIVQSLFFGLPLDSFASVFEQSMLRKRAGINSIAEEMAKDGGLIDSVKIEDPRRKLLDQIEREIANPGTENLPRLALISDFHADIGRTDSLLADILHELIGFEGDLERFVSIEEQLNSQGLSLQDVAASNSKIILNGDLLDRGKEGIECFFRMNELVESGAAQWILGNHDIWMTANLMKMHLPYYQGFNFYGDEQAERLIAEKRETDPEYFDTDQAAYQWALWLAEYNQDRERFQSEALLEFKGRQIGPETVRQHFIDNVYKKYSSQWDQSQIEAMEKFIGHFASIKVPDPYIGLNGIGKTSLEWWQQVHAQLNQGREARRSLADESEYTEWTNAVNLSEQVIEKLKQLRFHSNAKNKWYERIFESINTQAYISLEWWAKDWSSHKGWGEEAIAELNRLRKTGRAEEESVSPVTAAELEPAPVDYLNQAAAEIDPFMDKTLESLKSGEFSFYFMFGGAATRLGLGAMYFVKVSEAAKLISGESSEYYSGDKAEDIKDKWTEYYEKKIADGDWTARQVEELKAVISDLSRHNSGIEDPGMGPMQLIRFNQALRSFAKSNSFDPDQFVASVPVILHVNDQILQDVADDLYTHDFYGFNPDKMIILSDTMFYGFKLGEDSSLVLDLGSDKLPSGHGHAFEQFGREAQAYVFEDKILRQVRPSMLDLLEERGVKYLRTHRINDLTMWTDDVFSQEKLAYFMAKVDQGANMAIELVSNPAGQKGGSFIRLKGTERDFLAETLSLNSPELEYVLQMAGSEFLPYNAFRNMYTIEGLKEASQYLLPRYLRYQNEQLYLDSVTGDVTQFPCAESVAFAEDAQVQINDFKEFKNLENALLQMQAWDRSVGENGFAAQFKSLPGKVIVLTLPDDGSDQAAYESDIRRLFAESKQFGEIFEQSDEDSIKAIVNRVNALELYEKEFTQATYLNSKTFQEMARFYQTNANLYYKDDLGDLITHGWLPLNDEGKVSLAYKGRVYAGKDVFAALDLMAQDIKSPDTSLSDKWEAMSLANSWYADMTTKVKVNHVEAYLENFGVKKINEDLGVVNWFTGHNPVNKFKLPPMTEQDGKHHFEIDAGMGKKFGHLGFWADVSAGQGISFRGFESEDSEEIKTDPVLDFGKKGGKFENPGVNSIEYLTSARDHLKSSIREDQVSQVKLHMIREYSKEELENMNVLLRVDINVLDSSGKIKSEKRIYEALDTILYLIENEATVVLTSHNGRPKGKVDPGLSQKIIAERLQELLQERSPEIKVVFHENSITEKGLKDDLDLELVPNAVNFLENSRFFKGEEKNYTSFAKALASLADIFCFDAFGTAARVHATTAGAARYLPNIFKGFLMEKEDKYLDEALQNIYGIVMGGGPKLSEKLVVIKNVINNMPEGGFIALGSAPAQAFMKARYGIEAADKVSTENELNARKFDELAFARGVTVDLPLDFIACEKDLTDTVPGTEKSYLDLNMFPAGTDLYVVTLDQLRSGEFTDKGKRILTKNLHLYSVGPETAEFYRQRIMSTPEGKAVFQNGAVGVDEIPQFAFSQNQVWQAFADATLQNVITVAGGGDTIKSAERAEVTVNGKKMTADKAITHASTGGGASADKLQGKILAAEQDQKERQADLNKMFASLRSNAQDFQEFKVGERKIFQAQGGDVFKSFITGLKLDVNSDIAKGDLAELEWELDDELEDSRGRATIGVNLRIGDIMVRGEVPAGASTGEDEAEVISLLRTIKMKVDKDTVTVQKDDYDFVTEKQKEIADSLDIDTIKVKVADRLWTEKDEVIEKSFKDYTLARENLKKVFDMLEKANLDISRFDDLVQAENMIREAAGKNFTDLGANVTVPVSWALWRMSAALNDMSLKEYIRWNYADILEAEKETEPVRFYMNIYNGGFHAVRKDYDEQLGKDRIDIQEIMIVPYADTYAQALAMGDKVDLELKKILEARFAADNIARADEAGFSVKGLGSSTEAISYVIQAIKNAGFVPGEDVKLALDAAAASFYDRHSGLYDFMGERKTSQEMIDYYLSLAEQYQGVILSIEDGLDENDWDFWPQFTEAMTEHDILTIGDDLYVTQMDRFSKGNDRKAATAILIKVNQNGSVLGTLEVITEAIKNNVACVVSHRSGETLDNGIADLAEATYALGLKTGDPQPAHAGYSQDQLVRRNKYLRMIELEEQDALSQGKALVISTDFFKLGSATDAVSYVLAKMDKKVKVMIYGDDAENMKLVLGKDSVLTAPDLASAKQILDNFDFALEDRVLLTPSWENQRKADKAAALSMKTVKVNDLPMLALSKALTDLFPSLQSKALFSSYFALLEDQDIISEQSSEKYAAELIDKELEIGETLSMPDLDVGRTVSEAVKQERDTVMAFMTKI